jgi:hypothetical protein
MVCGMIWPGWIGLDGVYGDLVHMDLEVDWVGRHVRRISLDGVYDALV